MTIAELLVLNPEMLTKIQNDYEHRLSLLSNHGKDEEVDLMEDVLADYCINELSSIE